MYKITNKFSDIDAKLLKCCETIPLYYISRNYFNSRFVLVYLENYSIHTPVLLSDCSVIFFYLFVISMLNIGTNCVTNIL